jgi:class 3 adenylate cyclase/predicted ATPase
MRCPACEQENGEASLSCVNCGARLGPICPACGANLPPEARFCWKCGHDLGSRAAAAQAGSADATPAREDAAFPPPEFAGERRQLTVMFCDIVNSSGLARQLDPEDLRSVLAAYHEMGTSAIERFGGRVAQYLGDGILAYFAYPRAHEDDPERAVRAGLTILADLEDMNERLGREHGVRVSVRASVHTGSAVVTSLGSGQARETLALGHTVNVAEKLQEIAPPDSVVMTGDTLRLVRGLFVTQELGERTLVGESVPVYRAVQVSGVRSRLDVAVARGLTPLVGREQDLALLLERWGDACGGHGRVVLIAGEPGIGKSRLVHALRGRLAEERHSWLEVRGSPYHGNSALHPFIELLGQGTHLVRGEAADDQLARLERGLDLVGLRSTENVQLLAALLSLPLPRGQAPLSLGAEAQRRRTLELLAAWLVALARLQPAVFVFEDLHWADPTSLELLGSLIARTAGAPLLLLATFRTGFEPPWEGPTHVSSATVAPLTPAEARAMVAGILKGRSLPPAVLEQLVTKTDGVPIFIEELTQHVLESDLIRTGGEEGRRGPLSELAIPCTLQDSLAARLDRLGPAKDLAQLAAVVGREFSYELLAAVSQVERRSLEQGLAQLASAGLVYQTGQPPQASYTFKHALVHESAYQSLLKSTRRALHERIARVLEERFPERVASGPEEMARHCAAGGLIEEAIAYYQRAGEHATERSANDEAVGHLIRAIDLLGELPEGSHRNEWELVLQVSLGALLTAAKGWGSGEAERAYGRARELCERSGETRQLFQVVRGLVTFYAARAELETAHEQCERLLRLAESGGEASELLTAHQHLAILFLYEGDPVSALEHHERALAFYDPADRESFLRRYGEDPGVFVRNYLAWTLWIAGHPDRAVDVAREAIQLGREASHPFSLAYALLWASVVHVMRREPEPARRLAADAAAIAEEEGFAFVRGGGRLVRAWSQLDPQLGAAEGERAVDEFRSAMAQVATTGSRVTIPMILGDLGDACLRMARHDDALRAADAGLATSERTRQPFWDAELLRIKGEALLAIDGSAEGEAEHLLQQALEVSRKQQAKSHELRVAIGLARLWQRQGGEARARELLAGSYGYFREGFGSPDLVEARSLLDELS